VRRSSRVTNLLVRRARPAYRHVWTVHRWLYTRTGGRRFASVLGAPVLLLTVRGRRTGLPRSVLVAFARRDGDLVVCASHAGHPSTPDWYRNLIAAGEAEIAIGGERRQVGARPVTGAERSDCWRSMVEAFPHDADYQQLTTRVFPLALLEPMPTDGPVDDDVDRRVPG
jgi:deazaflavin-dependent oxidoreductase (nitroreductase family)